MNTVISIIVPIFNAQEFLDDCILSLLCQTYQNIEIILVDDGSTDDSGLICDEWAKKSKHIKVIHKKNGGVSSARNEGIRCSTGDYILMLDSDDALESETCEKLLVLTENKDADCIIFGFKQSSGNIWTAVQNKDYDSINALKKDFGYWLSTELLSSSVNKLYKKSLIKNLYPENISFGEDLIFSLSYLKQCHRISFITETFYLHNNLNTRSLCHTFTENRIFEIENWQAAILDFANNDLNKTLFDKYLKDLLFYIKGLYGCESIKYFNKKNILKKWSRNAFFYKNRMPYVKNGKDNFIFFCLKYKLWFMPYCFLKLKRIFIR
ncbi:Chondroitin polymerase [uncultured Bacteroides sp.]|uniref:glycosyltransferase family 2 protein n=1 Tax=Bacteroides cellulolyticus TaxID=2981780 RepID=UPI000823409E|nr:glycosyltransferase family 2 protein [Bacteroides cellulolyticus]MCU6772350.1 glycosyltransferase [Bacteroides cellulolyticus]SCI34410.1 Chondroitin polymerase [uncultured Bacteroides sp.]